MTDNALRTDAPARRFRIDMRALSPFIALIVLVIAAALLFVTAIANVANMQLARAVARQRELTIRATLGARVSRLLRQLLIENRCQHRKLRTRPWTRISLHRRPSFSRPLSP